jgi:hypothetical protein
MNLTHQFQRLVIASACLAMVSAAPGQREFLIRGSEGDIEAEGTEFNTDGVTRLPQRLRVEGEAAITTGVGMEFSFNTTTGGAIRPYNHSGGGSYYPLSLSGSAHSFHLDGAERMRFVKDPLTGVAYGLGIGTSSPSGLLQSKSVQSRVIFAGSAISIVTSNLSPNHSMNS